jgi:glycosyltransferase involved in cell wall biosynthesis
MAEGDHVPLQDRLTVICASTEKARPGAHIEPTGHNNPSYVFNRGIEYARAMGYEYVFFMSSDMIMEPDSLKIAIEEYGDELQNIFLHAKTYSIEDRNHPVNPDGRGYLFCGSQRPRPLGWFWGTALKHVLNQNGYDERFLGGIGYEDDDITGRVALEIGEVVIDDRVCGRHQYHKSFVAQPGSCVFNAHLNQSRWGDSQLWSGGINPIHKEVILQEPGLIRFKVSHPLWIK